MAITPTSGIPIEIVAGDTLSFTVSYAGYPPASNTLTFCLNKNGVSLTQITGTTSGDGYLVTESAANTAGWVPGRYSYTCYITAGGERVTVDSGQISIAPNMAVSQTPTAAQAMLAACNAAYLALATKTKSSVSFNGQSFTVQSLRELQLMRDRLRVEVQAEQRALGYNKQGGAKILVTRFTA